MRQAEPPDDADILTVSDDLLNEIQLVLCIGETPKSFGEDRPEAGSSRILKPSTPSGVISPLADAMSLVCFPNR